MEESMKNILKINAVLNVVFPLCVAYAMFEHNPQNEFTQNPEDVYITSFMFFAVFIIISSLQCLIIHKLLTKMMNIKKSFFYYTAIGIISCILTVVTFFCMIHTFNV